MLRADFGLLGFLKQCFHIVDKCVNMSQRVLSPDNKQTRRQDWHSYVCVLQREVVVGKDVCGSDIPGLHPKSGGQGWCPPLLECVAFFKAGGHQDGCASGCTLHTFKGEKKESRLVAEKKYPHHLICRSGLICLQSSMTLSLVQDRPARLFSTQCAR